MIINILNKLIILLIILNFNLISSISISPNLRIDCAPIPGENKSKCLERECIWDDNYDKYHPSVPLCYFPPKTGYKIQKHLSKNKLILEKLKGAKNPYGEDFKLLEFEGEKISSALHVRIGHNERFIPPIGINLNSKIETLKEDILNIEILPKQKLNGLSDSDDFFSFNIVRDGNKIWDTSIGGLLFSDQYIQIATYLPSDRIYGFGENPHQSLKHDFSKYTNWGMLGRDQPPDYYNPNSANLYGPTPEQVIQQFQQIFGRPIMPAYWALGYQFSRFGYKNLNDLKQTINRIINAKIPIDVVFADIDYMERYKDFSVDSEKWLAMKEYVDTLHAKGLRFVPIVDPAIQVNYDVFERAIKSGAKFIEWERFDQVQHSIQKLYPLANSTKIMLGIVWPDKHVAFPDFLDRDSEGKTQKWWIDEIKRFHDKLPFDGLWIDMDEPSNFATNKQTKEKGLETLKCPMNGNDSKYDNPPYKTINVYQWGPGSSLSEKTLCMLGRTGGGMFNLYDTHNLYGLAETIVTRKALELSTGKRGELISRSTFISSGKYGSHWSGDNSARWTDLRASIISVIEFNIFGIPHMGADVCGFNEPSNEELCLRWQQLGAFHPFFRNHNSDGLPPQDPCQWKSVEIATRISNLFRYQHLPFLYTLHFQASLKGGTVIRPLFFEFPNDFNTHNLNYQFLWGSSLMVIPVLDPGVNNVRGYFPINSVWYSISHANKYGSVYTSGYYNLKAPRDTPLPTFLRGGSIIIKQWPGLTTKETRKNSFQLTAALDPKTLTAKGQLYWDDGESIISDFNTHQYYHFEFTIKINGKKGNLTIIRKHTPNNSSIISLPPLSIIEILGYNTTKQTTKTNNYLNNIKQIILNGKYLNIKNSEIQINLNKNKNYLKIFSPILINLNDIKQNIWIIEWIE
uniref:P-type domain-containing protein n=1 Tax=Meloidogyne hapla TaxID=6305 RepID=A0A1I8B965_MELHA